MMFDKVVAYFKVFQLARIRLMGLFFAIIILENYLTNVICQQNKQKKKFKPAPRKSKKTDGSDREDWKALYILGILLALIFIPTILRFVYNVIRDPITPTLISNASTLVKEKTFGYLSKKKTNQLKE